MCLAQKTKSFVSQNIRLTFGQEACQINVQINSTARASGSLNF